MDKNKNQKKYPDLLFGNLKSFQKIFSKKNVSGSQHQKKTKKGQKLNKKKGDKEVRSERAAKK